MKKPSLIKHMLVALILSALFVGCTLLQPKPVKLSPAYQAEVESAVSIISVIEAKLQKAHDPNDCVRAVAAAKQALQNVLDANAAGGK